MSASSKVILNAIDKWLNTSFSISCKSFCSVSSCNNLKNFNLSSLLWIPLSCVFHSFHASGYSSNIISSKFFANLIFSLNFFQNTSSAGLTNFSSPFVEELTWPFLLFVKTCGTTSVYLRLSSYHESANSANNDLLVFFAE